MNFKIIINLNFSLNTKGTGILWHVTGSISSVLKQRQKNLLQMEGFC